MSPVAWPDRSCEEAEAGQRLTEPPPGSRWPAVPASPRRLLAADGLARMVCRIRGPSREPCWYRGIAVDGAEPCRLTLRRFMRAARARTAGRASVAPLWLQNATTGRR
jgi:hypothetical protein